jgi:hypothetical protein
MNPPANGLAFGAPGIEPRWTSSAKEGLGTAYHTSCRIWFTLSHAADATVVWTANHWASTNKADATFMSALNLWFADLPTEDCPDGSAIEFTLFWKETQRWEGRNHSVAVSGPK